MQRKAEINIGLTMGDPNGIGPEILLRALEYIHPFQAWQPLIFGDTEILTEMNKIMGFNFSFEAISDKGVFLTNNSRLFKQKQ